MAITNGYCTLAEIRARLDVPDADTSNDSEMESVIEAVSRWIDGVTRSRRGYTQFYAIEAEVRYFSPMFYDMLIVPDLLSIDTLKTDDNGAGTFEVTWTTDDYNLVPYNAPATGEPYTVIEISNDGSEAFPVGVRRSVEVTGDWGYNAGVSTACPDAIREACILASMRIWKRRDAIFGTASIQALGVQVVQARITQDADVMALIESIEARVM